MRVLLKRNCVGIWLIVASVIVAGIVTLTSTTARAATYSWQASSGDWSSSVNWSGSIVPTSSDTAYVANGGAASITQSGETCTTLLLGGSLGGSVQMFAGGLSANVVCTGSNGTGAFVQTGGSSAIASNLFLGCAGSDSGSYSLAGGSQLTVAVPNGFGGTQYVGYSGVGSFVQTGGTNTTNVGAADIAALYLGYNAGSTGSYNLSGSGSSAAREGNMAYPSTSATLAREYSRSQVGHTPFTMRMAAPSTLVTIEEAPESIT